MKAGLRSLAALLTLTLAVAGLVACQPEPAGPSDSIEVREGSDARLVRSDGLEIAIPGDAISGSGTLSTETVEQDGMTGWAITFDGDAELVGEAVITFPGDVEGDEPMPVLFYNEKVGDPLTYGGDTVETEDGRYTVTTTHFSNWFQFDWGDLLTKGKDLVKRAFGQTPDADVTCTGTTEAEGAGYTAALSGSGYTWCLGMDGTTPIVKIGNPNPYAIRVESTPGLVLIDPDETLVSLIPQLFSVLVDAPTTPGNTVVLLGGGDSYTFRWAAQADQQQGLQVMPSGAAYIASALLFSVDTVQLIWRDGTAAEVFAAIADTPTCTTGFADMAQADVQDGGEAMEYLGGAIDTVMACLGKVVEKLYGFKGIAAVVAIASASWLFSGIALAFTAVAAITNAGPATLVIDGPNVIKIAPTIDSSGFCRQLYDRPIVHSVTGIVGYSWDDVGWQERTSGIGVPGNPDSWIKCVIHAGGWAPPYEIDTLTEFYGSAADARELFERYDSEASSGWTSVPLDLGDGEGFLKMYDGKGSYNSGANGWAVRGNVVVMYDLGVGLIIGRRLGWPDQATLVQVATEVIDQALTGYGAPAQ